MTNAALPRRRETSHASSGVRTDFERATPRRELRAAAMGGSIGASNGSGDHPPGRPLRCRGMENEVVDSTDQAPEAPVEVIEELLVEEISIDGMCGVY